MPTGLKGRPYRRLCARVYAEESHCYLCGGWVDQSLDRRHPMSRTVDHVRERQLGGDLLDRANARLAHRRCNGSKGARVRHAQARDHAALKPHVIELHVDVSTL
ncbi:hypothetical protein GCM10010112_87000 [Actinoplanes lobatus]|uniref:HNH domain-containing protein n=1 Tax=Actinoplanes lobatus TaxID=113568 RepID=A0ABQ4AX75_9ACTN|nr:hypothetical protein GCM10010112_87000 [Actinoplanes lobatus]GIE45164.1 hypothetical protein Alo02nite_80620 [Actinoplanes lobatus]